MFDIEKKIKLLNKEIIHIEKSISSQQECKRLSSDLVPIFIDKDIEKQKELLSIKKEERVHLLEERKEGFSNKIFWSVVIPIIVTIVTTILLSLY